MQPPHTSDMRVVGQNGRRQNDHFSLEDNQPVVGQAFRVRSPRLAEGGRLIRLALYLAGL